MCAWTVTDDLIGRETCRRLDKGFSWYKQDSAH